MPVDFLRAIRAEHSGADDDCVESDAAILGSFLPCVTNKAAENIGGKSGVLDFHLVGGVDESREVCSHRGSWFGVFGGRNFDGFYSARKAKSRSKFVSVRNAG